MLAALGTRSAGDAAVELTLVRRANRPALPVPDFDAASRPRSRVRRAGRTKQAQPS